MARLYLHPNAPMRYPISLFATLMLVVALHAQRPITSVITDYLPAASGQSYTVGAVSYAFGNLSGSNRNLQQLTGFTLPNGTYYYNVFIDGQVKIRRVNNTVVSGRRSLLWMESATDQQGQYRILPPYNDSMELVFDGRTINRGTDNLFGNGGDGSGNNNNIERVDWITPRGMWSNQVGESGFAIFERGSDNAHDPFCVAPILAVNAAGEPTRYGNILRVTTAHYGNLPSSALSYSILRKEEREAKLLRTATGSQRRGGVFISFGDLGVHPGEVIYGYSLMAYDLPLHASPADLLDYTNPIFFPTVTSSNTSQGGIDLIAITGLFNTTSGGVVLPVRLQQFSAEASGPSVRLSWQLEQPGSCIGIEVERSPDGLRWQRVARLRPEATGFVDGIASSTAYYRLKLFETGSFNYSAIRKLAGEDEGLPVRIRQLQPLSGGLRVVLDSRLATRVLLQVHNSAGQLLTHQAHTLRTGPQSLRLPLNARTGILFVTLIAEGRRQTVKLMRGE